MTRNPLHLEHSVLHRVSTSHRRHRFFAASAVAALWVATLYLPIFAAIRLGKPDSPNVVTDTIFLPASSWVLMFAIPVMGLSVVLIAMANFMVVLGIVSLLRGRGQRIKYFAVLAAMHLVVAVSLCNFTFYCSPVGFSLCVHSIGELPIFLGCVMWAITLLALRLSAISCDPSGYSARETRLCDLIEKIAENRRLTDVAR